MADLKQRIESLYRSDVRGATALVVILWVTMLFVLFETWPFIPDGGIKAVLVVSAAAVLIFNTAAIIAMLRNYRTDKDFIYGLDIKHSDANRNRHS